METRPSRYRGTFHDQQHKCWSTLQIAAILTKTCLDGLADLVALRNIEVRNLRLGCESVLLKLKPWGRTVEDTLLSLCLQYYVVCILS